MKDASNATELQLELQPNPARAMVRLSWCGGSGGDGEEVDVFDVTGRITRRFRVPAEGLVWNLEDGKGSRVPSGVYFARVRGQSVHQREKVLIVR